MARVELPWRLAGRDVACLFARVEEGPSSGVTAINRTSRAAAWASASGTLRQSHFLELWESKLLQQHRQLLGGG